MKRSFDSNILKRGPFKQQPPSPNTDSLLPSSNRSSMSSSAYHPSYSSSPPHPNMISPYYPIPTPSFPSADQAFFNHNHAMQNFKIHPQQNLQMFLPSAAISWPSIQANAINSIPAMFDPSQPPPPLPQQPPPQPPQPPLPASSEMKNLSPYTRARPLAIRGGIRPHGVSRPSFYNANSSPSTTNSCNKTKQSDTEKRTLANGSVCSSTSTVSSEADSVREGE